MGERSNIQWTDDSFNFWRGCTKISPGCAHCYAETLVTTRLQGEWGPGKPRIKSKDFNAPLRWNERPWVCDCGCVSTSDPERTPVCPKCEAPYHRRRVFSLSLGDIGDPEVPLEMFNEAMIVIDKCRNLTWQLLTKRPEEFLIRWAKVCKHWGRTDISLPENVWIGVSCENQEMADLRIPQLLAISAKAHFISAEPLIGPIQFGNLNWGGKLSRPILFDVNWVIWVGESGPNARPCNVEWIRSGVRQCKAAGVPAYVKQLGAWSYTDIAENMVECDERYDDLERRYRIPLTDKKGGDISESEWPDDLRVREFPTMRETIQ